MDYRFRPLSDRSGLNTVPEFRRSRYTFKASWPSTMDLLARELDHLSASQVVIEADFSERDLRLDGLPRSNARQPIHPGVRLAFESKHGPLIYATDTCAFWQHNVRSIALGLEALRAVDRYGITRRAEQYAGWKAIGGGTPMPAGPMTIDEAAAVLAESTGEQCDAGDFLDGPGVPHRGSVLRGVRAAVRRTHPDHGGDRVAFERMIAARDVLLAAGQ